MLAQLTSDYIVAILIAGIIVDRYLYYRQSDDREQRIAMVRREAAQESLNAYRNGWQHGLKDLQIFHEQNTRAAGDKSTQD